MTDEKSFQLESDNNITIIALGSKYVTLEGQLVKQAESDLLETIEKNGNSHLIIDMTHTRFFGSAFIEALVRVWNQVKKREQGSLQLCCLQKYCKEVIEVTHLDRIWKMRETREEAISHCNSVQD